MFINVISTPGYYMKKRQAAGTQFRCCSSSTAQTSENQVLNQHLCASSAQIKMHNNNLIITKVLGMANLFLIYILYIRLNLVMDLLTVFDNLMFNSCAHDVVVYNT